MQRSVLNTKMERESQNRLGPGGATVEVTRRVDGDEKELGGEELKRKVKIGYRLSWKLQ